jgi:hypothetical protein
VIRFDDFPAALPNVSPLAAARLTGLTCDEQDRGAEVMHLAICKQTFVAAAVLVAAGIIAERTARAAEPPQSPSGSTQLTFAGLTWQCKAGMQFGPGPNRWAPDRAWVDQQGRLHLKIAQDAAGNWCCAEVASDKSFGYGEYRFTFAGPLNELDPNIVLGLFTYLDDAHEIDFELSRWGQAAEPNNAQFVVQPAKVGRMCRFATGEVERLTCSLVWTAGRVQWQCWQGTGGSPAKSLAAWTFTGNGIPVPSRERVHMNLWLMRGQPPNNGQPAEVVVESFEFRAPPQ